MAGQAECVVVRVGSALAGVVMAREERVEMEPRGRRLFRRRGVTSQVGQSGAAPWSGCSGRRFVLGLSLVSAILIAQ
jgi:hypothetical protein